MAKEDLNTILVENCNNEKEIFEIERMMLEVKKPNIWNINAKGNMEVEMEVGFEKFLLSLCEHTNQNPEDMSVFGFNSLIELLKEKTISNG